MPQLEGRQSVMAALSARKRRFEAILVSHQAHAEKVQPVLELAEKSGVPVRRVDGRELSAMAHGSTHGGVVALCSAKPLCSEEELERLIQNQPSPLLLLLEGIDDARNLGFTLRSAEALGAAAVLVKKHLWDFDETEVARPSSGAYERLPLVQIESVALIQRLQRSGMRLFGCLAGARRRMFDVDLRGPTILAVGGEKRGLSAAVRELCNEFITIPSIGGPSSLALSHACAILLAEAMRQRTSIA